MESSGSSDLIRMQPRLRGPTDPSLAAARVCYDHLAGASGVWMTDRLRERGFLNGRDAFNVSTEGVRFFESRGLDMDALTRLRRPFCRTCLDWSERRFHLGGALGAAILQRIFELRWARREERRRAAVFSTTGERAFRRCFGDPCVDTVAL